MRKNAQDLLLPGTPPDREFDIRSVVARYIRTIAPIRGGTVGIGGRPSINFVPAALGAY